MFRPRELFRGLPLRSLLWGSAAAIFSVALLCTFGLLISLLVTRGSITLPAEDREHVANLTGDHFEKQLAPSSAPESARDAFTLRDTGIFPAVWYLRDTLAGKPLSRLYLHTPWLHENGTALVTLLLAAAAFGIVRALLLARSGNLAEAASQDVAAGLRRMIHRQALRLGPGDLTEKGGEQALQLFLIDVEIVRKAVAATVARLGRFPVKLCLLGALAVMVHWRMTLLAVLPLVGCWWLVHKLRQRSERNTSLTLAKADAELKHLAESFSKTRLVRGFNMETWEHEQFQNRLMRFQSNLLNAAKGQRWVRWSARLLVAGGLVLVAFLAGSKVLETPLDLPFAKAVLLLLTVAAMYRPLEHLRQLEEIQIEGSLAADRIFRYIDQLPEVSQAVGAKFLNPLTKALKFEKVSYTLPRGRTLLDQIDLSVPAGETIAVVSLDPLEPRALVSLLPRFTDPQKGRVLIDGEDIATATLESLRAEVIWASGSDAWFTGTVLENLTCGATGYSLPDLTAAAKMSHAHNFIQKLPQGYETVLGTHGETPGPGQSFRLSLARAVLRNPALLIIEEPTETMDDDTKDLLDDAYNRILRERTTILLPARLSTLKRADRIVFLHKGQIEAVGKHNDLVRKSDLYRHWEYIRFNEFRHEVDPAAAAT